MSIGEVDRAAVVVDPSDNDVRAVHAAVRAEAKAHPAERAAMDLGYDVLVGEVPIDSVDALNEIRLVYVVARRRRVECHFGRLRYAGEWSGRVFSFQILHFINN